MKMLFVILLLFCSNVYADEQKIFIQIRFNAQTEIGEYNDAIYYIPEGVLSTAIGKWLLIKQTEIDLIKQERVNIWTNSVKNPPPYKEPTVEELQAEIDRREEELSSLKSNLMEKLLIP